MLIEAKFTCHYRPIYEPLGFIHIDNNGCCNKDYFVVTKTAGKDIYSCECGCGGWCTNGHEKMTDAINEYFEMCKKAKEELNNAETNRI